MVANKSAAGSFATIAEFGVLALDSCQKLPPHEGQPISSLPRPVGTRSLRWQAGHATTAVDELTWDPAGVPELDIVERQNFRTGMT